MVKNNLEHRHAFVRRNAVLASFAIFKSFEHLLPDAPELVEKVLLAEADPLTKRNAFLMLFQASQERAVTFLTDNLDQVASWTDSLQLIVLELIRKVVRSNPLDKSKYIRCILTLFNSPSPAVTYECASVLIALSSSNTAIKAAATSYTQLLASQSDNNIKLIVLERLQDLKKQHPKVVTELIMDILRALASANLDIRKKTLDITLDLVSPSTIGEVMQVLKKEIAKTSGEEGEKNSDYRAMLITAIHKSATKFPDAVSTVVPILMDFLGDSNQASAVDVILFVREIVETYVSSTRSSSTAAAQQQHCHPTHHPPSAAAQQQHSSSAAALPSRSPSLPPAPSTAGTPIYGRPSSRSSYRRCHTSTPPASRASRYGSQESTAQTLRRSHWQ